jgi:hypothetical protein
MKTTWETEAGKQQICHFPIKGHNSGTVKRTKTKQNQMWNGRTEMGTSKTTINAQNI